MIVNFDSTRENRTGIPEIILAGPKQTKDLIEVIQASLRKNKSVMLTRIKKDQVEHIEKYCGQNKLDIVFDRYNRTAIIGDYPKISFKSKIAVVSAGTSDLPIVEEIIMSCNYFGIEVISDNDAGVAGIHRHQEVLEKLDDLTDVKLLIVVAGNEGALFSVISGQSELPIIAVPTSIGYGFGGKGLTALQSALQSCSPGIVTVNIDNGFGAAAFGKKFLSIIERD